MGYGEGVFEQAGAEGRMDGGGVDSGEFGGVGVYVRYEKREERKEGGFV